MTRRRGSGHVTGPARRAATEATRSYQLLPNPDASGDEPRVALLDGRLPGAAPVGQRGADDHPRGPVGVDVPEDVDVVTIASAISQAGNASNSNVIR